MAEYTLEELMIEYLEYIIEHEPHEAFARTVQQSGKYVVRTGDAQFDEWQRKAAAGEAIDFSDMFDDEESKKLFEEAKERTRFDSKPGEVAELPEFSDKYGEEP